MGMKQFNSQRINIVIYHTTAALLTYCLLEQIGFCTKSMGMKQYSSQRINITIYHTTAALLTYCL